ncbi:MAG: AGE family epimerase/isomerase, partial [Rhodospirillaceae bacterium]|nr:AGE family epimerase/isomerase [Rhodospirillaceae bacterium]
ALFAVLQQHAADPAGGYRETLARDWTPAGAEHRSLLGPYPADAKTSGSHIQLLEAFTALYRVAPSPALRRSLAALEALLAESGMPGPEAVRSGAPPYFADYRDRDGRPLLLVGHAVKELWFRLVALLQLGTATSAALDRLRTRFDYLLDVGYDAAEGGFFNTVGAEGTDRSKTWWAQAEGLLGSLLIHRYCGSARARHCFLGTLDWIERFQADWQAGEWHAVILEHAVQPGDKGGPWKTAYHNGRAMLDGMVLLGGD